MKTRFYLPFLLTLITCTALPADIWWVGENGGAGGDGIHWSDPDNWSGGVLPTADDIVRLGFADNGAVTNSAQNIVIDANASVNRLFIDAIDDRSVSLTAANDAVLTIAFPSGAVGTRVLEMGSAAGSDTFFDVPIASVSGTFWFSNHSASHDLVFGPNSTVDKGMQSIGVGSYTFQGSWAAGSWRSRSGIPVTLEGASLGGVSFDSTPTLLLKSDSNMSSFRGPENAVSNLQRAADGDLTLRIHTMLVSTSSNVPTGDWSKNSPLVVTPTAEFDGHLTIETAYFRILSNSITTDANSTVEIYSHGTAANRVMQFGTNGISGEGNLRLNMDASAHVFTVQRQNDYTGRTILERGILAIGSHTVTENPVTGSGQGYELGTYYGGLPSGAVVEISSNATLRLNAGAPQTLGGLLGYNASFGTVQLQGAELTIDSQVATAFGGEITGDGTLVKTGAETFTLTGNYTNPAGRTLRLEEGIFEVLGEVSLTSGIFEIAGGRLLAGSLVASNQTWDVSLSNLLEGERLTEVTTADITNSLLNLSLSGDLPSLNSTFTLVYASDSIIGADASNMFGYEDGDLITIGDYVFTINWVNGSESIVLTTTAIPEPAHMVVAMALLCLLAVRFRKLRVKPLSLRD